MEIQVIVNGLRVDGGADIRVAGDLAGAGSKNQLSVPVRKTQAFRAGPVQNQVGLALLGFDYGKCKIALDASGQGFTVTLPAMRKRGGHTTFTGHPGKFFVAETGASHHGHAEPGIGMDICLAKTRSRGNAHLGAAVSLRWGERGAAACRAHVQDQFLMRAVVAHPAKNAIHGVLCRSDAG